MMKLILCPVTLRVISGLKKETFPENNVPKVQSISKVWI
jgi:hypothetical protein